MLSNQSIHQIYQTMLFTSCNLINPIIILIHTLPLFIVQLIKDQYIPFYSYLGLSQLIIILTSIHPTSASLLIQEQS